MDYEPGEPNYAVNAAWDTATDTQPTIQQPLDPRNVAWLATYENVGNATRWCSRNAVEEWLDEVQK